MLEKLKQTLRGQKETGPFRVPGEVHDGSRVLALATGDLADLLFHVPLLASLRRTYPGASIDFLVPEQFAPLIIPSGLARQVMVYAPRQLTGWKPAYRTLQRSLAGKGYDISYVLSQSPAPPLEALGLATGARMRLGPSHAGAWPAVNLELRPREDAGYAGDRLHLLAPFLGLEPGSLRTTWPLPTDKLRQTAQVVHFNKPRPEEMLVGVDPGPDKDGRAPGKETLRSLVAQLRAQLNCRVLPLSSPEGEERRREFESLLPSPVPPAFNRDTLLETMLLLCQCNLFVASNTDLFHMAVAEGIPTVGLFGQHVGGRWRPRRRARVRVLTPGAGKPLDLATLMEAVTAVMADDPPAGGDDAITGPLAGPLSGPSPAPGT